MYAAFSGSASSFRFLVGISGNGFRLVSELLLVLSISIDLPYSRCQGRTRKYGALISKVIVVENRHGCQSF